MWMIFLTMVIAPSFLPRSLYWASSGLSGGLFFWNFWFWFYSCSTSYIVNGGAFAALA